MTSSESHGDMEQSKLGDRRWRMILEPGSGAWSISSMTGNNILGAATQPSYPAAAFAFRKHGSWTTLSKPEEVGRKGKRTIWSWSDPKATVEFITELGAGPTIRVHVPGADTTSIAWLAEGTEHFYGLGERFDKLDQRGELIELWVKNGASGGETYKPVPFIASSRPYGVAINTSNRVFVALAHPTLPDIAAVTVESPVLEAQIFIGEDPLDVLADYTSWIGRPSIPPAWFFRPWKSRDWRVEDQATVYDDLNMHDQHDLPLGVKLIDAMWETESHSFEFDSAKYPDVDGLMKSVKEAGAELVLWISPNMTCGSPDYEECAREGYLITGAQGEPYIHRLGNQPGWEGTSIDFSNPRAVEWWQEKVRSVMEIGARGLKTDFGEQVPIDAHFHNGKTGAEMHNLFPVLYNKATWEVVKEYDGILLARSGWAGSQRFPGIWAGDQSADFSPWGGLPSAIVAGISAGWSGFPYWGSDVGGYFNSPDDEVFCRWAQFGAVSPVMEVHGLGCREPWEFSERTLSIYREAAKLHDRLVPYSLAASKQALDTGIPLMRAMALLYPELDEAHSDWVQYQYMYGPALLAAPVYSWGTSRQIWFPPGEWIDFDTGAVYEGPNVTVVDAPLEKLPLFVRSGAIIPTNAEGEDRIDLLVFGGGAQRDSLHELPDGTAIRFSIDEAGAKRLEVSETSRSFSLQIPYQVEVNVLPEAAMTRDAEHGIRWTGPATVMFGGAV